MITDVRQLPLRPNLDQYKKQAKDLVKSVKDDDAPALELIKKFHPHSDKFIAPGSLNSAFKLADAQFVIGRSFGFESWPKFAAHVESVSRENSPSSNFEQAAGAIVNGDLDKLRRLLAANPELIHLRSEREHNGTLLHYVSANGLEDYRQKTPANIVAVAEVLFDAGADVNAEANMYGGRDTILGLAASSIHPENAGVMEPLLQILVQRGASVTGVPGKYPPLMAAITNHRPAAVDALFNLGAPVHDIISAAAVGDIDKVKSYLNEDGSLDPAAMLSGDLPYLTKMPADHIAAAFIFAGVYGRAEVLELMMSRKVSPGVLFDGFTALHWACGYGHLEAIDLLLEHKAPLEIKNSYGGTVLDSTLWFGYNAPAKNVDYRKIIRRLIDTGARTGVYPEMQKWIDQILK
jgi:ankyrin repeat protein